MLEHAGRSLLVQPLAQPALGEPRALGELFAGCGALLSQAPIQAERFGEGPRAPVVRAWRLFHRQPRIDPVNRSAGSAEPPTCRSVAAQEPNQPAPVHPPGSRDHRGGLGLLSENPPMRHLITGALFLFLFLLVLASTATGAETVRAGAAVRDITPPPGMPLGGYGDRFGKSHQGRPRPPRGAGARHRGRGRAAASPSCRWTPSASTRTCAPPSWRRLPVELGIGDGNLLLTATHKPLRTRRARQAARVAARHGALQREALLVDGRPDRRGHRLGGHGPAPREARVRSDVGAGSRQETAATPEAPSTSRSPSSRSAPRAARRARSSCSSRSTPPSCPGRTSSCPPTSPGRSARPSARIEASGSPSSCCRGRSATRDPRRHP